jgi:hypothetical protein
MHNVQLTNEELNLYTLPNIIRVMKPRKMRCAGHVACMGEMRIAYTVLIGKPGEKRPCGIPRCRWENKYQNGS